MFDWLRKAAPPLAPAKQYSVPEGARIYAVGDVHGAYGALEALQSNIIDDVRAHPVRQSAIVYLGDYIDRGERSYDVVRRLIAPPPELPPSIALRGNHEQSLLDCLADPERLAGWREFGGLETLMSYGVDAALLRNRTDSAAAIKRFRENLPDAHLAFFNALPFSFSLGGYFFCHAGVRPGVALEQQSNQDLMWIRDEFLNHDADFGARVVHGHTPTARPEARGNRINVDTGACVTGVLTCAVIEGDALRFLTN